MKYQYMIRAGALPADLARFHPSGANLTAAALPLFPVQLGHAPERMGDGDRLNRGIWFGLRLLPGCRAWRAWQLLPDAVA